MSSTLCPVVHFRFVQCPLVSMSTNVQCPLFAVQVPDIIADIKEEMRKVANAFALTQAQSSPDSSAEATNSAATDSQSYVSVQSSLTSVVRAADTDTSGTSTDSVTTSTNTSTACKKKPSRVSFWNAMEQEQTAAKRLKQSDVTDTDSRLA